MNALEGRLLLSGSEVKFSIFVTFRIRRLKAYLLHVKFWLLVFLTYFFLFLKPSVSKINDSQFRFWYLTIWSSATLMALVKTCSMMVWSRLWYNWLLWFEFSPYSAYDSSFSSKKFWIFSRIVFSWLISIIPTCFCNYQKIEKSVESFHQIMPPTTDEAM